MKKLILPLLLLLGITMLMAVESAPSAVVGYVKYDCLAGLNMVALPMDQAFTTSSELGMAYPGMLDGINAWDAASQTWVGSVYYPAPDDVWDPELPIGPGTVYMVNATTPFSMYSIGAMPAANASYALIPGLNTLMVPLNKSALSTSSLLGVDVGILDGINYWDAASQTWVGAVYYPAPDDVWDPEFTTGIGMPLMVNSTGTATWPAGARGSFNRNTNSK